MPEEAPDNPATAFEHVMGRNLRSDTYTFRYHGYGVSHIDALCHFAHNGRLYNDVPMSASTSEGCGRNGIHNLKSGIVTRGILLDLPRLKGVPLPRAHDPDLHRGYRGLGAAGRRDRLGRRRHLRIHGPLGATRSEALGTLERIGEQRRLGTLPSSLGSKERDVAFVGSDAATDVMPSMVEGITQPLHTFLIAGLGSNIFDNMDLEALAETAARLNRWEFMLTVGPIPVTGGTGSPLNPIAVF